VVFIDVRFGRWIESSLNVVIVLTFSIDDDSFLIPVSHNPLQVSIVKKGKLAYDNGQGAQTTYMLIHLNNGD